MSEPAGPQHVVTVASAKPTAHDQVEYTFHDTGLVLEGMPGEPLRYRDARTGDLASPEQLAKYGLTQLDGDE